VVRFQPGRPHRARCLHSHPRAQPHDGCSLYPLWLRGIPLDVADAIWSGAGLPVVALMGWGVCTQALDAPALQNIGLIVSGVLVMSVRSRALTH